MPPVILVSELRPSRGVARARRASRWRRGLAAAGVFLLLALWLIGRLA